MKKTIIVTEGNRSMNSILGFRLKKEGYNVLFFEDDKKATEYINKNNSFDLLIINIYSSQTSNIKAIRHAINHSTKKVPILVVSPVCDEDFITNIRKMGADDFIEKPFSTGELIVRINRCFSQNIVSLSTTLNF